jgi:dolichol-phosphate mannosyltransferase
MNSSTDILATKKLDELPARHVASATAPVVIGPDDTARPRVAVVIPCHRVRNQILRVIERIPDFVDVVYVVDDLCPEESGRYVQENCKDHRVLVVFNQTNLGVGGAVMAGYTRALADGIDVIVKMDGDDQMDAAALPQLVGPILRGEADYAKGNRFYDLTQIGNMPGLRIFGNAMLSFMTKISSGYWDIFDPTNGYTAIHAKVVAKLPLSKISRGYFFETDMLFRLNTMRAVVADVPMDARYGDEISNMRIWRILLDFFSKHVRNTCKRIFYNYFLRDLSLASVELVLGSLFVLVGAGLGAGFWFESFRTGVTASAGSVMLAALQVIVGIQLILGFLAYDIASVPRRTLHPLLGKRV